MKLFITLVAFATVLSVDAQVSMDNPRYCYATDPIRPQNGMHSSQSAYEAIQRPAVDPNVSSCTPSRFWLVSRHGGRLPNADVIELAINLTAGPLQDNIVANYRAGRTTLCAQDFEAIRDWRANPNITVENAEVLTVTGWNSMVQLAQRYQNNFPSLLPRIYNRSQILFRHTERQRSQGSLRAFADGLFGGDAFRNVVFEDVPTQDILLRPDDFCPAYDANSNTVEQDAFRVGPEVMRGKVQINAKLGFLGSNQLSSTDILTLWNICRFEKNIDLTIPSAWCAAFSIANSEIFEFLTDLGYYYTTGYGARDLRLVENLSCALMQDMLRYLQSSNPSDQRARIYGTHGSGMQLMAVALGAFQDEVPMNRFNIAQSMNRLYKNSWISPKGANLAVVRYDCADGDNDVLFLWNERPLQIPGCQTNGLCKVDFILQRYQRYLNANCPNTYCTSN